MVVLLFALAIVAIVGYWVGRGVRLNQLNRACAAIADEGESLNPESLVDLRSGEIIEPGTKKYARAAKIARVRFE